MQKTMRWVSRALMVAMTGLLLMSAPQTASAQRRVVIIQRVPVFDPFFTFGYPYAYPPGYVARNYGYIKVKTNGREAAVYVDGGYAVKTHKTKEFALRPGTHNIELRDSDGRTFFQERVAVMVGQTTKIDVPS
jgi:PEGA domain